MMKISLLVLTYMCVMYVEPKEEIGQVQCHPHANLRYLKSIFRLHQSQKSLNLDVSNISPIWKDISTNLGKANKIINNYLSNESPNKPPDPIYTNPEYSVYLLKDKYDLRHVGASCAQFGLVNFLPTETATTLAIMKALKARTPSITQIPVFIRSVGDGLFNSEAEHLTNLNLWKAEEDATPEPIETRKLKYEEFNLYPALMSLGQGKTDLIYASTKENAQSTGYHSLCQSKTRPDLRGSAYKANFKNLLTTFEKTATAIAPLFTTKSGIQDKATATQDGNSNLVKIFPSSELLRLSKMAFDLSAKSFWNEGEATNSVIQEATKLLLSYGPKAVNKKFPIKLGSMDQLKSALGLNVNDYLSPNVKIDPTSKTTALGDFSLSGKITYEFSKPEDEIKMYQILPNNVNNKIIEHQYLFKDGNDYYAENVDLVKNLRCRESKYCILKKPISSPLAKGCGNFIVSNVGAMPDSCEYRQYDKPIGYEVSCKKGTRAVISVGSDDTSLDIICGNSNLGKYQPKLGISYLNTSCQLKLGNQIVLPHGSGSDHQPPVSVTEEDESEITTYSILAGTSATLFITMITLIFALFRKIEGKGMCDCISNKPIEHPGSVSVHSLKDLNDIFGNDTNNRYRDEHVMSRVASRQPSPVPSAPMLIP